MCFHRNELYTLTDAYACGVSGRTDRLPHGATFACWSIRMLAALDIIQLPVVPFPDLPPGLSPAACAVAAGIVLLVRVRWAHSMGEPAPLGRAFLARWCAVPESSARDAVRELLKLGFVRRVSQHGATWLFMPGAPAQAAPHEEIGEGITDTVFKYCVGPLVDVTRRVHGRRRPVKRHG